MSRRSRRQAERDLSEQKDATTEEVLPSVSSDSWSAVEAEVQQPETPSNPDLDTTDPEPTEDLFPDYESLPDFTFEGYFDYVYIPAMSTVTIKGKTITLNTTPAVQPQEEVAHA